MAKAKKSETGKHPGGRPSDFKPEFCEQAEKLCKLGATDKEMADFFGVVESTINNWKIDFPEFLESLKRGKLLADANVACRLYQRAMGFEHDSEEIKVIHGGGQKTSAEDMEEGDDSDYKEGDDHPSVVRVPIKKIYPPDTTAAIFWLKNRQPKKWRDKVEQGFTDNDGNDVPPPVTVFQIPDNGRGKDNKATGGLPNEGAQQSG